MSDVSKTNEREKIELAIGEVLSNVSNFPEVAHARLWGQNMAPLREKLVEAVTAALATRVPVQGEPNDDREALLRRIESFDYDSDRVSDDLEQDIRALVALSRATVPDAATERFKCDRDCVAMNEPIEDCSAHGRTPRDLWEQIDKVVAERDAALAAVAAVRALHWREPGTGVDWCAHCIDNDGPWPCATIVALDGAPEPEEKR